jgi:hypothetical protein
MKQFYVKICKEDRNQNTYGTPPKTIQHIFFSFGLGLSRKSFNPPLSATFSSIPLNWVEVFQKFPSK